MARIGVDDERMRSSPSRIGGHASEASLSSSRRYSHGSYSPTSVEVPSSHGIQRSLSQRNATSPRRVSDKSRWGRVLEARKSPNRPRNSAPPRQSLGSSSPGETDRSMDVRDVSPPPVKTLRSASSSAPVETTNAPAWAAVVRRVQAEEFAREAAVSDLAAYVEQAIVSITARVEAVVAFECRLEAVERITTTLSRNQKPITDLEESVQDIAVRCEEFMQAHAASSKEHEDALGAISTHVTEAFQAHVVQVRTATTDFAKSARELGVRMDRIETDYRKLDERVAGLTQDFTSEIQGRLLENCKDVFADAGSLEVPSSSSACGATETSSLVELANAFDIETSAILRDTSAIIRAAPATTSPSVVRPTPPTISPGMALRGAEVHTEVGVTQTPFAYSGSSSSSRQPSPNWRLARTSSEGSLSSPMLQMDPRLRRSRSTSMPRYAQALQCGPSMPQAPQELVSAQSTAVGSQSGAFSRTPSRCTSPQRLQVAPGSAIATAPSRTSRALAAPPPLVGVQLHTAASGQATPGWASPRSLTGSTASSNATLSSAGGFPSSQANQVTMGLSHEALG